MKKFFIILVLSIVIPCGFYALGFWHGNTPVLINEETIKVKSTTQMVGDKECVRDNGRWYSLDEFCPVCGHYIGSEVHCGGCGAKTITKGSYFILYCSECEEPIGVYNEYCNRCGARGIWKLDPDYIKGDK